MLQTFGKSLHNGCKLFLLCMFLTVLLLNDHCAHAECDQNQRLAIGEQCKMSQNDMGECVEETNCPALESLVKSGRLRQEDVCSCGWSTAGETVCCPVQVKVKPVESRNDRITPAKTQPSRPAITACSRFESDLGPAIIPHILGGIPAELGEFPHMAAIGYSSETGGNLDEPYDFRCGGSLIESRFVLTAAHCVNSLRNDPSIVRLGVVNFNDVEQMRRVVDVKIKEVHIHDGFGGGSKYNDIAILELERDVQFTPSVRPACLYTELADPSSDQPLYVTGWGTVNLGTREKSSKLLKAPIKIFPLTKCNASLSAYGLTRHLARGVLQTQICAHDSTLVKDACQGDSGGPLSMLVDDTLKTYRIVGIISAGHSCATSTPGLYTRVAAYLDYIEGIVWPAP